VRVRRLYAHVRGEPGQAMVEFALVLPILMLVILGIIKFGILYNNWLQLTDGVRSGARQYAVERGQSAPCTDSAQAIVNAAGALSTDNLTGSVVEGATTWSFKVSGGVPAQNGSTGCPTLTSGDAATVSASYPCDLNVFGIDFYPSCKLTATATERVE
jgi:Flp pilus assembly protein TadG